MADRFPPLAPQEKIRTTAMAKARPAPSLALLDVLIFGLLVALLRMF